MDTEALMAVEGIKRPDHVRPGETFKSVTEKVLEPLDMKLPTWGLILFFVSVFKANSP